jgi:hypothetical protein
MTLFISLVVVAVGSRAEREASSSPAAAERRRRDELVFAALTADENLTVSGKGRGAGDPLNGLQTVMAITKAGATTIASNIPSSATRRTSFI